MASLHSILSTVDGSQPSIHAAAAAMMRHYDKSAGVAVNEWRSCLYSITSATQILPLLYICNEVLQNSKRNRGTKFLEAFSPILGQALQYMCQKDTSLVEKVRRTAKIWGDRAVYSPRFISALLQGLESFRNQTSEPTSTPTSGFSPMNTEEPSTNITTTTTTSPSLEDLLAPDPLSSDSDTAYDNNNNNDDDDDNNQDDDNDDNEFGTSTTASLLHITVDASQINNQSPTLPHSKRHPKRQSHLRRKRRKSVLSTTSLMDLWNQVASLQQSLETSKTIVAGIHDDHLTEHGMDLLVGDELMEAYQKVKEYQTLVHKERVQLHKIAQDHRALEREAIRYIHWCRSTMVQDNEDLEVCTMLEQELRHLIPVHHKARLARDERRATEAVAAQKSAEERYRRQELEERKKLLEAAMKKQDVAEEGMVWNPTTQEYQYLNTNEDWRN